MPAPAGKFEHIRTLAQLAEGGEFAIEHAMDAMGLSESAARKHIDDAIDTRILRKRRVRKSSRKLYSGGPGGVEAARDELWRRTVARSAATQRRNLRKMTSLERAAQHEKRVRAGMAAAEIRLARQRQTADGGPGP